MNKVCVIIPMFNFGEHTKKCIDLTIQNAGIPVDILVVDDGSEIPYKDDRVNILRLEKNSGFTNAINQGIIYCDNKYEYIQLLNNDTEPKGNFISELLDIFGENQSIGVASSIRIMNNGNFENMTIDLLSGWTSSTKERLSNKFYYVSWVPFCSVLIKNEVIRYVGLLDRRMRNHCSDNDFCVRAGILDYRVVLVTGSEIGHIHQVTTNSVGINAAEDQKILLSKIRHDYMTQLLEKIPLDGGTKLMGKLEFTTKEKDNGGT